MRKRLPTGGQISNESGFTLVEMIVVIVITGIIGATVAVFLRAPAESYTSSARRAEMTDSADTALRRISRDLRLALPNSVRVTVVGSNYYLEFLPTSSGGRYRAALASVPPAAATGNMLDFSAADSSFDVFAPAAGVGVQAGDVVAIYNLGIAGASAYAGDNTGTVAAVGAAANPNEATIALTAAKKFPFDSPGNRFQVIRTPVTYVCAPASSGSDGSGTLSRWWGYAIQPGQPTTIPAGASSALLAGKVSACTFKYDANVVSQRGGLVTMTITLKQSGESVYLYSATHVTNIP